jgi:hypothetical protein
MAEGALEADQAAEAEELLSVFVSVESTEHAGEIAGGGDLGAQAAAEWFAARVPAEVFVAA